MSRNTSGTGGIGTMDTRKAEEIFNSAPKRMRDMAEKMLEAHKNAGLIEVSGEGEKAWKGVLIEACMAQESAGRDLSREASKGALRRLSQFKEGEMKWRDWREEVEDL